MNKLSEIQQQLKVPKNQFNSFGKYNYRSCEDILSAVKPLLGEITLTFTDEIVNLGDRFYIKATATLKCKDESVSVSAFAREDLNKKGMDQAQLTGSCSSYARKYALNGLFLLDDTKEIDSLNNKKGQQKPQDQPQSTNTSTSDPKPMTDAQNRIWDKKVKSSVLSDKEGSEFKEWAKKRIGSKAETTLINDFEKMLEEWISENEKINI